VTEIEDGERLVWSLGCVVSEKDIEKETNQKRHAMIIGAGEVGKQLYRGLLNDGWTCEFIRRNDADVRSSTIPQIFHPLTGF
jgi:glutamyl-tRNA reductase